MVANVLQKNSFMKQIGENIRLSREFAGLSQDALAAAIGRSRHTLLRIEQGKSMASCWDVARIAKETQTDVAFLLEGRTKVQFVVDLLLAMPRAAPAQN